MRYQPDHKLESREKILAAAGQAFRSRGFGGIGVDGLAKGAHLTSGAFYVHFASKLEAFTETVRVGLEDLRAGIAQFRTENGRAWLDHFAAFYMGERRTCDLRQGCALPTLSAEVERVGGDARTVYQEKLLEVVAEVAAGLDGSDAERRSQAWQILAALSGGVTMARTVTDPALSREIAQAIEQQIRRPLAQSRDVQG